MIRNAGLYGNLSLTPQFTKYQLSKEKENNDNFLPATDERFPGMANGGD